MMNDAKSLFQNAVKNSLQSVNRVSFDNIRIASVVGFSSNSKRVSVRITKTGELINDVALPKGGIDVSVNDIVIIICPDLRTRNQNYVLCSYGSGVPMFNSQNGVVTNSLLTGATITNSRIVNPSFNEGSWSSWTPTWTGLSVYNATVTAKYYQLGELTSFRLGVVLGSSSTITTSVNFSLPKTSVSYSGTATLQVLGQGRIFDSSPATTAGCEVDWVNTTTARIQLLTANTTYVNQGDLGSGVPWTWATNDEIYVQGFYESV